MFLLAKLIWINMAAQTSVAALEDELDERSIPTEINEASVVIKFIGEYSAYMIIGTDGSSVESSNSHPKGVLMKL